MSKKRQNQFKQAYGRLYCTDCNGCRIMIVANQVKCADCTFELIKQISREIERGNTPTSGHHPNSQT